MKIMKYEYKYIDLGFLYDHHDEMNNMLNNIADEGWELFHVGEILHDVNEIEEKYQQYIFRRPKLEK